MPESARHIAIAPRPLPERGGIDLQLHQVGDRLEGVAEQETGPLQGAEQVAYHREGTALDTDEIKGRSAGLVDAPVDGRGLQVRVDLLLDADQLGSALQIGEALAKAAIT